MPQVEALFRHKLKVSGIQTFEYLNITIQPHLVSKIEIPSQTSGGCEAPAVSSQSFYSEEQHTSSKDIVASGLAYLICIFGL